MSMPICKICRSDVDNAFSGEYCLYCYRKYIAPMKSARSLIERLTSTLKQFACPDDPLYQDCFGVKLTREAETWLKEN